MGNSLCISIKIAFYLSILWVKHLECFAASLHLQTIPFCTCLIVIAVSSINMLQMVGQRILSFHNIRYRLLQVILNLECLRCLSGAVLLRNILQAFNLCKSILTSRRRACYKRTSHFRQGCHYSHLITRDIIVPRRDGPNPDPCLPYIWSRATYKRFYHRC